MKTLILLTALFVGMSAQASTAVLATCNKYKLIETAQGIYQIEEPSGERNSASYFPTSEGAEFIATKTTTDFNTGSTSETYEIHIVSSESESYLFISGNESHKVPCVRN